MNIKFSSNSWNDYLYWQKTDNKTLKRINTLIRDIQRQPYEGIEKPGPLKHGLSDYWSRKINDEHRIVYKCDNDTIKIPPAKIPLLNPNALLKFHFP